MSVMDCSYELACPSSLHKIEVLYHLAIAKDAVVGVYLQHLTLKLNLEVTSERSAIAECER